MKLSERLIGETKKLWTEATKKEFLVSMARGTLDKDLYKNYMIQDYLYLMDYIKLLKRMLEAAEDEELRVFFKKIIKDTEYETYKVHVPGLRALGITDKDIGACEKGKVITDYIGYMQNRLEERGIIAGLTALLQCSWNYAYIAGAVSDRYSDELSRSPYKSWFDAYTCKDYTDSNQLWIDMLDKRTGELGSSEAEELCLIFKTCAGYENSLWDYFWRPQK